MDYKAPKKALVIVLKCVIEFLIIFLFLFSFLLIEGTTSVRFLSSDQVNESGLNVKCCIG